MSSLPRLQEAAAYALSVARDVAGVAVTYQRASGGEGVPLTATLGNSVHQSSELDGMSYRNATRDFLVKKSDLPGEEPQEQDTIVRETDGERITYQVIRPDGQDKHFRYMDLAETEYRIHTIEYKREPLP